MQFLSVNPLVPTGVPLEYDNYQTLLLRNGNYPLTVTLDMVNYHLSNLWSEVLTRSQVKGQSRLEMRKSFRAVSVSDGKSFKIKCKSCRKDHTFIPL